MCMENDSSGDKKFSLEHLVLENGDKILGLIAFGAMALAVLNFLKNTN